MTANGCTSLAGHKVIHVDLENVPATLTRMDLFDKVSSQAHSLHELALALPQPNTAGNGFELNRVSSGELGKCTATLCQ
jgi:hypothetical protein